MLIVLQINILFSFYLVPNASFIFRIFCKFWMIKFSFFSHSNFLYSIFRIFIVYGTSILIKVQCSNFLYIVPSVFYFFTIFFTPKLPLTSSTFTKYKPCVRLEILILFSVVFLSINCPSLL